MTIGTMSEFYLVLSGNLHTRLSCEQEEKLLIGDSTIGWVFMLYLRPNRGINSLSDWYKLWKRDNNKIVDTDGMEVSIEAMLNIITNREQYKLSNLLSGDYSHIDQGQDGLYRYKPGVYADYQITRGPGSWDCVDHYNVV